jgi:hypothetical protein
MTQEYYVAQITKQGWQRISENFNDVRTAQDKHKALKPEYPYACIVVDASSAQNLKALNPAAQ